MSDPAAEPTEPTQPTEPTRPAEPTERAQPLRSDPDFRRYWLARQVSVSGSLVTAVALPVLVYRLSHSRASPR